MVPNQNLTSKQGIYMLKKFLLLFLTFVPYVFFSEVSCVEIIEGLPDQTISFKLPDNKEKNWKEITRYVNKNQAIVESIPVNQNTRNWTDLICIQFMHGSLFKGGWQSISVDDMLMRLRNSSTVGYPEGITTWRLLEKNDKSFIFESILHEPYKQVPQQHEVVYGFLTDSGFHRIGFTKKNSMMSQQERKEWVNILKENVRLVPYQDFKKSEELSLVDQIRTSYELTDDFSNWKNIHNLLFDNGYVHAYFVPNDQLNSSYITEDVEVISMPNCKEVCLGDFFEKQKEIIYKKSKRNTKIRVVDRQPKEIIYYYSQPHDHLQLNSVVRTVVTDYGYYSMSYRVGLKGSMENEDIRKWQKILKSIKIDHFF